MQVVFGLNTTIAPSFLLWKQEINNKVINFRNCTDVIQTSIADSFIEYDKAHGNYLKKFNITKFGKFWDYIETKFNCTGWCQSEYEDSNHVTRGYFKYLASDVNRGVVEHQGCLKSILDWLPPLLRAYGIICVFCSFFGIMNIIFAFSLLTGCYKVEKSKKTKA